jgi:hypothetical protein
LLPSHDLSFTAGSLDSRITFTRASAAYYFDSTGTLQQAATNAPRFSYNPSTLAINGMYMEQAATNQIRNPRAEGAAAGTPGTSPTNWLIANNVGVTSSIIGTGTESGIPYVDVQFTGTASGAGVVGFNFESGTAITAATANNWSNSAYVRLVAGTLANITSAAVGMDENTGAGAFVTTGSAIVTSPTAAGLATQRVSYSRTLSGGGTVGAVLPWYRLNVTGAGAMNCTLRFGITQMEKTPFITSNVLPAIGTPAVSTRAVESALFAGTLLNAKGFSIVAEGIYNNLSPSGSRADLVCLFDASGNNGLEITNNSSDATHITLVAAGTFIGSSNINFAIPIGTPLKCGLSLSSTANINTAVNGGSVTNITTLSGSISTFTQLSIGYNSTANTWRLNGFIRRIRYWPRILSNSELQAQTT